MTHSPSNFYGFKKKKKNNNNHNNNNERNIFYE